VRDDVKLRKKAIWIRKAKGKLINIKAITIASEPLRANSANRARVVMQAQAGSA